MLSFFWGVDHPLGPPYAACPVLMMMMMMMMMMMIIQLAIHVYVRIHALWI